MYRVDQPWIVKGGENSQGETGDGSDGQEGNPTTGDSDDGRGY